MSIDLKISTFHIVSLIFWTSKHRVDIVLEFINLQSKDLEMLFTKRWENNFVQC